MRTEKTDETFSTVYEEENIKWAKITELLESTPKGNIHLTVTKSMKKIFDKFGPFDVKRL
jgi:hypothetical protein